MWNRIKSWLAWLGAAAAALLVALFLGRPRAERLKRPIGGQVDKELASTGEATDRAGKVSREERAKLENRRKRARDLNNLLPAVILLAILLTATPVPAAGPELPDSYDQLATLYLEMVDVAHGYKTLYEEAEASNERLLAELDALRQQVERLAETVTKQQQLIERQQESLLNLLGGLEVRAGVDATSLSPIQLTPWLALSYRF